MADKSPNGSLRGPNMTRVTASAPTLYDAYGAEFRPPRDPLNSPASPNVIYRDIPIMAVAGDWTITAIRTALAAHKVGQFAGSAMLTDETFGDDRVQATLGSRTGALFGQRVIHQPAAMPGGEACAEEWKRQWPDVASQSILSESKRWAIMEGFSVSEILWDTSVTPWRPTLKPWHPMYIYYRWDIRRLVANTTEGPVVIEPGDGKWFVHAPFGFYRGWIHGAIRAIAEQWMIKRLAWRDWARFNERHGLPIIKAYVPAAGDARQKEQFIVSMSTLGQEAVVGLPQNVDETGYDLELLEARDRAWETFKGAVEGADRSIILTIKGQNLTTEISEGSFAAARQHGNTEQVTLEFDNSTFAHDFYHQVSRPFAKFNFGDPDLACYSEWDIEPIEDKAAKAKTILDASTALLNLKQAGAPIDLDRFVRDFDIPIDPNAPEPSKVGTIFKYHIDAGIATINEVRKTLGLEPVPDGDVPTQAPNGGGGDAPTE